MLAPAWNGMAYTADGATAPPDEGWRLSLRIRVNLGEPAATGRLVERGPHGGLDRCASDWSGSRDLRSSEVPS